MQQKAAVEPGNKDMSDIKGLQAGRESGRYHQAHDDILFVVLCVVCIHLVRHHARDEIIQAFSSLVFVQYATKSQRSLGTRLM